MATGWFDLLPVVGNLLDRVIPDPKIAAESKLRMLELAQQGDLAELNASVTLATGQMEVNKVEAASDSGFKSNWRPATGWTCVAGLFYQVLARPLLGWVAVNAWKWSEPPPLEMDTLMTLLFGLLGLGAYRTVEKMKVK